MYRPFIQVTLKGSKYVIYTRYTSNGYEFHTGTQKAIKYPTMCKARVNLQQYKAWYELTYPNKTLHIGGC